MTATNATDVLIVGAGPTGLTVATLLARFGLNFRIIDKGVGPAPESRALGVHARTLELWDKIDLADGAVARGQVATTPSYLSAASRNRGSRPIFDMGQAGRATTRFPYMLIHEQSETEQMLLDDLASIVGPNGPYGVER